MKVVLDKHPQIVAYALEAIKRAGLKPVLASIRLLDKARQSV
jgi:tripeptide aminopeptidase